VTSPPISVRIPINIGIQQYERTTGLHFKWGRPRYPPLFLLTQFPLPCNPDPPPLVPPPEPPWRRIPLRRLAAQRREASAGGDGGGGGEREI